MDDVPRVRPGKRGCCVDLWSEKPPLPIVCICIACVFWDVQVSRRAQVQTRVLVLSRVEVWLKSFASYLKMEKTRCFIYKIVTRFALVGLMVGWRRVHVDVLNDLNKVSVSKLNEIRTGHASVLFIHVESVTQVMRKWTKCYAFFIFRWRAPICSTCVHRYTPLAPVLTQAQGRTGNGAWCEVSMPLTARPWSSYITRVFPPQWVL